MKRANVLMGITIISLLSSTSLWAEGKTLQERIAERRAAIAEKAAKTAAEKKAANIDPEQSADFWRITKYHIPEKRMFGITVGGGGEARFYAAAPATNWDPEAGEGTDVYFYEYLDGVLHLAGRGEIRKLRKGRRSHNIEATIEAFRYARATQRRMVQGYQSGITVQQLTHGKNPRKEKWYMSTRLTGPDTLGWTMDHREAFARELLWVGMTEWAAYATLGQPESKLKGDNETRLIFDLGIRGATSANLSQEMGGAMAVAEELKQRVSVKDGIVVGLDPKQKVTFD